MQEVLNNLFPYVMKKPDQLWKSVVETLQMTAWAGVFMFVFGLILGLLFGYWYGRDAYYQFKAIWQEKTYRAPEPEKTDGPITSAPADDKITVTNLQDAKEVDFEKE